MSLSVIIPCFGRPKLTEKLLCSLAASSGDFEVLLVDDASPVSLEFVAKKFSEALDLTYIRHSKQKGPAAARNRGILAAKYEMIAFTDNDCEVTPSWAKELSSYLRDAPLDVVGVGGRVLSTNKDIYSRYMSYHKILDPFLLSGRFLYIVTANCAFRKKALEEVGGFDESLRHPGGEDPGLCFQLLQRGYQLHYKKEAIIYHNYQMNWLGFAKTFFRYGEGCRIQTEKYARNLNNPNSDQSVGIGFGGIK